MAGFIGYAIGFGVVGLTLWAMLAPLLERRYPRTPPRESGPPPHGDR